VLDLILCFEKVDVNQEPKMVTDHAASSEQGKLDLIMSDIKFHHQKYQAQLASALSKTTSYNSIQTVQEVLQSNITN
jgi:hypothetical protein